jgi:hypothetical protein
MREVWIVGTKVEGGWMAEGVYLTEKEAADAAQAHEFIALVDVGSRIPTEATDARALYWPKRETWHQSKLYRMRASA